MNRFIAAEKRILARRLYLFLIGLLLLLTVIYKLLPEKSKTSDIKVAVYLEDKNEYAAELQDELAASSSLYHFYYTDSPEDATMDVQSGYAECGFIIPKDFFSAYINGTGDVKVSMLETPSTTLSAPICETLFHYIFKVSSPQILVDCVGDAGLNEELRERMNAYVNGDTIFQMESLTDRAFDYENISYHIELPVFEFACLLLLFAGMFGLLLFMRDRERDIYIALGTAGQLGIECSVLLAAIVPVFAAGLLAILIVYKTAKLPAFLIVTAISFILPVLLSLFIKKSTAIAKLMPILLFMSILYFFVNYVL